MSEEIIIDGVNVAECEYMLNNKIKGKQHCPAKAMPYAKETSCICRKSINTPYNFCKHNPNCHYKQLKRLQAENERLKANFNNNSLCNKIQIYEADEERMRKALEEIRDIAGNIDDIDKWIEQNLMPSQVCERIEKINNKINEVLK